MSVKNELNNLIDHLDSLKYIVFEEVIDLVAEIRIDLKNYVK